MTDQQRDIEKRIAWDRQYAHEIATRIQGKPYHEVVEEIMCAFSLLRIQEADRLCAAVTARDRND